MNYMRVNYNRRVDIKTIVPFPVGFVPTDLVNLFLWFDSSDGSSITHSGGVVSQWNDKSGAGNHVVQATEADKPSYSTTAFNSRLGIIFDGTSEFLQDTSLSGVTNNTSVSLAIVAKFNDTDGNALLDISDNAVSTNTGPLMFNNVDSTFNVRSGSSDINLEAEVAFTETTKSHVFSGRADVTQRSIYIDGTLGATDTDTETTRSAVGLRLGRAHQDVLPHNGVIMEIVVCASQWDDATRQQVETYLANKWATNT